MSPPLAPPTRPTAPARWVLALWVLALWVLATLGLCPPAHAGVTAVAEHANAPLERADQDAPTGREIGRETGSDADWAQLLRGLRAAAQAEAPPRTPTAAPAAASHRSASASKSAGAVTPASSAPTAATAAWRLGLLALHGVGMAPDPAQAQHWFERAQALGHPLAPAGLAWCEISGCVTSPNPAAASGWTAPLARTAPALAKYLDWYAARALAPLGKALDRALDRALGAPQPLGTPGAHAADSTAASPARAAGADPQALLQAAAQAGNAQAMNALGLEYVAAGLPDKALAQFRAAASQSAAAAANARMLSSQMQSGNRLRSTTTSALPATDAAPGSPDYAQAQRYHRGDGVPANYTEAVRLYQAAASQGDARARKMLELIFSRPAPGGALDPGWMQQLASLALQPQGLTRTAPLPLSPQGWQQDPSPLYHLIPLPWRQAAH